jgi:hypothetical protein
MKKPRFTVLRALGILVGLLFVVTAPLVARDMGLLSIDGISYILVSVTLGLVFIAYGVTSASSFPAFPLRFHSLPGATVALFYLVFGANLAARPESSMLSRVAGGTLILFVVISVCVAFAKRRHPPAA